MSGNQPILLKNFTVGDSTFWKEKMELVRKEVIPYQWEILNDRVENAAPSFCMRNFEVAGRLMKEKKEKGRKFVEPKYTFRGFESLPEDRNHLEDKFYGFVFQDSDFSKWIEAVAYSLMNHPDKELEEIGDKAIDLVCLAQQENGYLDTYYIINGMDKIFTNLRDHHELYCFGHLVEGAVAYYEATGKDKLLKAAIRFADFIADYFGTEPEKCKGYPGHEIAEMALIRLYEAVGDEKYLNLSRFFIEERGKEPYYFTEKEYHDNETNHEYHQSHLPVRKQEEAVGHAVRAVYLYSGMADLARLTGDKEMQEACKKLWKSITREKMYITGGIGGTHMGESFSYPFDLPNDTAYAETCASIGLIFFARRMLEMEVKAEYADIMEQALYNTVLSGMALDGKSFFYVNPLEVWPPNCMEQTSKAHVKPVRQKWFGVACCPPNIARTLASLGQYLYFQEQDMLYINLYIGNTTEIKLNDHTFKINMDSSYPWQGKIEMKLSGEEKVDHTLAFRIPYGSSDFQISINGEIVENPVREQGYLKISREFQNDTISIRFSIPAVFIHANPEVRADIGKIAIMKGPLVYCLEEIDNGENLASLYISSHQEIQEDYDENILKGTSLLHLHGRKLRSHGWDEQTLYQRKEAEFEEVELTAVPYCYWGNRKTGEMLVWLKEWFE